MPSGRSCAVCVDMLGEAEAVDQLGNARALASVRRQVEQPGVELEVLPNRQLRYRARRTATCSRRAGAMRDRCASTDWPNSSASAFRRRQKPGQHLHRGRLAAAVRADEAEDLAPLDREAHVIDRGEIAEPAGEIARRDHGLTTEPAARRNYEARMVRAAPLLALRQ